MRGVWVLSSTGLFLSLSFFLSSSSSSSSSFYFFLFFLFACVFAKSMGSAKTPNIRALACLVVHKNVNADDSLQLRALKAISSDCCLCLESGSILTTFSSIAFCAKFMVDTIIFSRNFVKKS